MTFKIDDICVSDYKLREKNHEFDHHLILDLDLGLQHNNNMLTLKTYAKYKPLIPGPFSVI